MPEPEDVLDRARRIEAILARPEDCEPKLRGRRLLRLSARPSRQPTSYAWAVVKQRRDSPLTVREIMVPHLAVDGVRVRDVEVEPPVIESRLKSASTISIPVVRMDYGLGLDGTFFALMVGNHCNSAEIRFWGNGPEEWRDLVAWAKEMMAFLHERVALGEPLDLRL